MGWAVSTFVAAILVVPMWSWLGARPTVAIGVGMGVFFLQLWVRRVRGGAGVRGGVNGTGAGRDGSSGIGEGASRRGLVRGFNRRLLIALSAALLAWYLAEPFG